MNSFSNIEIVNFDHFENEDELNIQYNFNLDSNCEMNFISNFITDRNETNSSDNFPDNRSCSAFSDFGLHSYSCNNSVLGDQLTLTDNFKAFNLNDSLSQCEKESCNSYSYKPSDSKNILIGKTNNSKQSLESSYDLENIEYECIGKNVVVVDNEEILTKKWIDFTNKKKSKSSKNLEEKMKDFNYPIKDYMENCEEANEKDGIKEKLKLYKCTFESCMKAYKSKENLTLHFKNIHLKEKPYTCKFCKATFSHRNGNLNIIFILISFFVG